MSEMVVSINSSNIIVQTFEQTILDIVKKSLTNVIIKDNLIKSQVILSKELIDFINNIISTSPDTLIDIEKSILAIINDGNIDSKDIPNLIIIIQQIYNFIYSLKNVKLNTKKRCEITGDFFKYIIRILVLERKIQIEDEEKTQQFYIQIDSLIDSCISLLSFSKDIKPKKCFKIFS